MLLFVDTMKPVAESQIPLHQAEVDVAPSRLNGFHEPSRRRTFAIACILIAALGAILGIICSSVHDLASADAGTSRRFVVPPMGLRPPKSPKPVLAHPVAVNSQRHPELAVISKLEERSNEMKANIIHLQSQIEELQRLEVHRTQGDGKDPMYRSNGSQGNLFIGFICLAGVSALTWIGMEAKRSLSNSATSRSRRRVAAVHIAAAPAFHAARARPPLLVADEPDVMESARSSPRPQSYSYTAETFACQQVARCSNIWTGSTKYGDQFRVNMIPSNRLGDGWFGCVFRAELGDTPVAAKAHHAFLHPTMFGLEERFKGGFSNIMKQVQHELDVLESLQHRSIIRFVGVANAPVPDVPNIETRISDLAKFDHVPMWILTELAVGTMYDLIHGSAPLSPQKIVAMALDIAEGLEYMHDHGYIHGDLKPENILRMKDGSVKIADLGTAKFIGTQFCDLVEGDEDSQPSRDIFAFGFILVEMVLKETCYPWRVPPWESQYQLKRAVGKVHQLGFTPLGSIIEGCVADSAADRWDSKKIVGKLRMLQKQSAELTKKHHRAPNKN